MLYSFHQSDLAPGAPRVLPYPLIPVAIFMGMANPPSDEIAEFIMEHSDGPVAAINRWYIEVTDITSGGTAAAQASYVWQDGQVVCEAISVEPGHQGANIQPYLDQLGSGLWLCSSSTI